MNKERRKAIAEIVSKLDGISFDDLKSEIETLHDEEQDYLDNMPESFQNGDKGSVAQAAIDALAAAMEALDSAQESLDEAKSSLNEAEQ